MAQGLKKGNTKSVKTIEKKNQEKQENKLKVMNAKETIMEEYKANLPEHMEKELNSLAEKISKMDEVDGLSVLQINELLRPLPTLTTLPKYNADQLRILFDYYRKAIMEVNKKYKYPPTKENFCAFIGISTGVYDKYLRNITDEEKQEVMLMIDDYIKDSQLTSAQLKETDTITTIFRGKASHGMVEAQSPIVIQHQTGDSAADIMKKLNILRQGGSLNEESIKIKPEDITVEE